MTNHWNDIDNSSCVIVMGANPAENHPACFAHINAARYGAKNAKLIVVDPRQTRTARQANRAGEFYVRIRPGTDIAFLNAMMKWIMDNAVATSGRYNDTAMNQMIDWHNGFMASGAVAPTSTAARNFYSDTFVQTSFSNANLTGATWTINGTSGIAASGFSNSRAWPKYTDTRLKVSATGNDYLRGKLTLTNGANFSNMPVVADTIEDPDSVWQKLKAHVRPYDLATAAGICGCTEAEIVAVAKAFVDNSRFASSDFGALATTGFCTPQDPGYKATTFLYAMGQTQHTYGSQNIKCLAELQVMMGNMGRPGGGINALRGIHNVQGSTDFGNLYDSIPGYSGNPPTGSGTVDQEYINYQDQLFGVRVANSTAQLAYPSGSWVPSGSRSGVNCLSNDTVGSLGLQQRGFHNMTQEWFGNGKVSAADMGKLYALWPKGNGYQHIETFRKMAKGTIKAAVVWGQNPAVTEPSQSSVREGLRNLEMLVCVDMFETETVACDRKPGSVTYLIPACAHPEEAGSVTNSGRWLQWRERARAPKGNSRTDLELMLRFAYHLDQANAFTRITDVWASGLSTAITGTAYDVLYKRQYGWSPADADFETATSGAVERWAPGSTTVTTGYTGWGSEWVGEKVYSEICGALNTTTVTGAAGYATGGTMWIYTGNNPEAAWNPAKTGTVNLGVDFGNWKVSNRAKSRDNVQTGAPGNRDALIYARWGWSWLLNRRVFYNNSEVMGDRADTFVSPHYLAGLFTTDTNFYADFAGNFAYRAFKYFKDRPSTVAWSGINPVDANSPHWLRDGAGVIQTDAAGKAVSLAGRFSAHTEPYESPSKALQERWGKNTSVGHELIFLAGDADGNPLSYTGSKVASWETGAAYPAANYPLVLTSIRCVEHFQGGPITRNNPTNVETEPEPWIEINPVDARKYGISNGDLVNVITARSNSAGPTAGNPTRVDEQRGRSADGGLDPGAFAKGFRARVDNSIAAFQRVAPGVVAIPWHWGDRGLSTGSRANDLCIDAWDANTQIPEYKACLCKIEKA